MKYIFYLLVILFIISCEKENNDCAVCTIMVYIDETKESYSNSQMEAGIDCSPYHIEYEKNQIVCGEELQKYEHNNIKCTKLTSKN